VKAVLDPTVIGGVLARVGDEVFDGSIRTRLDDAKQHLGSE
jgi:F0F1-type ATP synthase delta subunit